MQTAEDILTDKDREMVCVAHDLTVFQALERMVSHRIGAVLVQEGANIVGIWTERDFMRNSIAPEFDPRRAKIGQYMTSPIHSAPHTASLTKLMDIFLGLFVRHILIEKAQTPIGLVSIGDVVRANLLEKDRSIRELNSMVSWQYYENWGWGRKKRNP